MKNPQTNQNKWIGHLSLLSTLKDYNALVYSHEIIFGLLDIHTLKYKKQATNVYMSYNICTYRKTFKMTVSIHNADVVNLLTFPSHPIHRWSKILLLLEYVCLSDLFMRSIMWQGATGIVLPKQHGFCSALYPQENVPPLGVLTCEVWLSRNSLAGGTMLSQSGGGQRGREGVGSCPSTNHQICDNFSPQLPSNPS